MPEALFTPNERQRLEAVRDSNLLGTPAEERFDKITRLARKIFHVSMAAIDIVGENVAWIKSAQGFKNVIGLRKDTYCHHTVLNHGICLISDARKDARVFDSAFANDWVFYAGVPLAFKGERIGVLYIVDHEPREFTEEDQETLMDLAKLAEQEICISELSESQLELARRNEELEKKNRIDILTHGWNEDAIIDIAKAELQKLKKDTSLALLIIEIDHFKEINEMYGHTIGDRVLSIVAERIRAGIRPYDAVGRYNADELLAILLKTDKKDVLKITQRICDTITANPITLEDRENPIIISCNIGCALTHANMKLEELIKRAKQGISRAKNKGRNRISN